MYLIGLRTAIGEEKKGASSMPPPSQKSITSMLANGSLEFPNVAPPPELCHRLQHSPTLSQLVLTAWQLGLWFAHTLVEQELQARAARPTVWGTCSVCGRRLQSKGFAPRQVLTLVGC